MSSSPILSCAPPSSEAPSIPTTSIVTAPVQKVPKGRSRLRYQSKLREISVNSVLSPAPLGEAVLSPINDHPCGELPACKVAVAGTAEDAFGSPRGQLATATSQNACPRGNPPSAASVVSFETSGFSGSLSPFFQSACPRGNPPSASLRGPLWSHLRC